MKRAHLAALPWGVLVLLSLAMQSMSFNHEYSQNGRGHTDPAPKHTPVDDGRQLAQLIQQTYKSCEQKDQTIHQLKVQVSNLKQQNQDLQSQLEKIKQTTLDQTKIQLLQLRQKHKLLQAKLQQQTESLIKIKGQLSTVKFQLDQSTDKFEEQSARLIKSENQLSTAKNQLDEQTTRLEQQYALLINIESQLSTTKIRLQEETARKDCVACPQVECPTITCPPRQQCKCQICKQPLPCQKPSPCPQPTVCPPEPKPCKLCPEEKPCPQIQCPKAEPCPTPKCPIHSCQSQILQITSLEAKNQALQSAYSELLKQRDVCLKDDSNNIKKQELIQIKNHLAVQLTQILTLIESTFFSSSQTLNFFTIKSSLDQIRSQLHSQDQVSWSDSLAYYRRIFSKLIEQLDSVSSLTADTIQLNNKYSSGLKSLRDRLARCESFVMI